MVLVDALKRLPAAATLTLSQISIIRIRQSDEARMAPQALRFPRRIVSLPKQQQLLQAIGEKKISPDALNINQIRKLLASRDPELVKQVRANGGTIRDGRNPEREKVVGEMRAFLLQAHWTVQSKYELLDFEAYGQPLRMR